MSQRELLTMISAIMALMALGIDLMLPAFDDIRKATTSGGRFTGDRQGHHCFLFRLSGRAARPTDRSPTDSDAKPILYIGSIIYLVGAVGSALAPTFELLLLSRFVWGIGCRRIAG